MCAVQTLCRWIMSVRINYHDFPYYNWMHAVTVMQTTFAMITVCLSICLSQLNVAMCHTVVHTSGKQNYTVCRTELMPSYCVTCASATLCEMRNTVSLLCVYMYVCMRLQTGKMARYFGDLELFALLVACLAHNIGYRGVTYSMLVRSATLHNRARQLYKNISMLFLFPVKDGKLSTGYNATFNASCYG